MPEPDGAGYTPENSPWRAAMKRAMPDLPLPKPPESLEKQLQLVLDLESSPSVRASVAADLLVELRAWLDDLVAKANEIHAIEDRTVDDFLDVAQRTRELRVAGHEVIVVRDTDDDGKRLRPAEVRPATAEEIAMVEEWRNAGPTA